MMRISESSRYTQINVRINKLIKIVSNSTFNIYIHSIRIIQLGIHYILIWYVCQSSVYLWTNKCNVIKSNLVTDVRCDWVELSGSSLRLWYDYYDRLLKMVLNLFEDRLETW